jgi:hypothetical protein
MMLNGGRGNQAIGCGDRDASFLRLNGQPSPPMDDCFGDGQ